MTLRDAIVIRSSPGAVWEIVADPALTSLWNPKCVACDHRQGLVAEGSHYRVRFRMKGPEQEARCDVIACVPGALLTTRYSGEGFGNGGFVDETFRLDVTGGGTRLRHAVDLRRSGIPWMVRVAVAVIAVCGYKVGRPLLENIRELAESPSPRS